MGATDRRRCHRWYIWFSQCYRTKTISPLGDVMERFFFAALLIMLLQACTQAEQDAAVDRQIDRQLDRAADKTAEQIVDKIKQANEEALAESEAAETEKNSSSGFKKFEPMRDMKEKMNIEEKAEVESKE